MQRNPVPRAPRIGIPPEKIKEHNIKLEESLCKVIASSDTIHDYTINSIMNISVGGMKIVIGGSDAKPEVDYKIEISFVSDKQNYELKGRVAWSENIAGGNFWIGIELRLNEHAIELFKLLTGEEIN